MTADNTVSTGQQTPVFPGTDVPVQALFDYLDEFWNLHAFLQDYPSVTPHQALDAMMKKWRQGVREVINSDRQTVSGTPRFVGTRVFVRALFDYLVAGDPLSEFLEDFPGVTREQAQKTLELSRRLLESVVYEDSLG